MKKIIKLTTMQMILDDLRHYIKKIETPVLPNEIELSKQLGVSRLTVREAITVLEREGLVSRVQGKGTMVNQFITKLENRIDIGSDIEGVLKNSGYKVRFEVPNFEYREATEVEISKLGLEQGDKVLVVTKHLYANEMVAAIYTDRIPEKLLVTKDIEEEDLIESIFPTVERLTELNITHDVVEMYPSIVDEESAKIFDVPKYTPLLCFNVCEYTADSTALMYNTEYYVDKFVRFTLCRNVAYKGE